MLGFSLSLSPSLSASPSLTHIHTLSFSLSLKIKAYLVVQCLLLLMKPAPVHASEDGEEDMKEALFNWFGTHLEITPSPAVWGQL